MLTLLSDVNIEGHFERIVRHMKSPTWIDFFDHLDIRVTTFEELGLPRESTDAEVWRCCQDRGVILLTNNRNDDGPNSLDRTIRFNNELDSLPVFNLANSNRVMESGEYLDAVVESLIDKLETIEARLGAGRIYLP